MSSERWNEVCAFEDLIEGAGVGALVSGRQIALFLVHGRVYALDNFEIFNLMCLPPDQRIGMGAPGVPSTLVFETAESALVPLMEAVERDFSGVKAFSLPSIGDGHDGRPARRHVELGVKGDGAQVEQAFAMLQQGVQRLGAAFELTVPSG